MYADCHIHMLLDGVYWREAIARHENGACEALVRQTLAAYQKKGITYLRDGGDRWGVCTLAARLAPEYGIRYRTPAFPIHRAGRYGGFIGRSFETMEEYRALVLEARRQGAHFIKIMISGLMDFDHLGVITDEPLPPEEIREMVCFAHEAGFAVMAHANGDRTVAAAISAGIDSIEHGAYLSEETIYQLAQSETVWTPTLVTVGNLIGDGRFPDAVLRPLLESAMRNVALAARLGAKIAVGSDAGAYRVMHARGAGEEYTLLSQAIGAEAPEVLARGNRAIEEKF